MFLTVGLVELVNVSFNGPLGWSWKQMKTFLWTAWCALENIQHLHLASLALYFHFIHSDADLKQFYEHFGEGGFQAAKGFFFIVHFPDSFEEGLIYFFPFFFLVG